MVMIRLLKSFEVFQAVENTAQNESCPEKVDNGYFVDYWRNIIDNDMGFVLGKFTGEKLYGSLGAIMGKSPFENRTICYLVYWFVLPEYRGKESLELFKYFEREAKSRGAKNLIVGHLAYHNPEKMRKFYLWNRYHEYERHYLKEV